MKILNCISLNYKQIKLDIRKSFAFDDNVKLNIMKQLTLGDKITQCILLCTCNRTEVYFDGIGWLPVDATPGFYYDNVTLQQMVELILEN